MSKVRLIYKAERGQGRGVGGPAQGDGGADECYCPECGESYPKVRGVPCHSRSCEECGSALVGQNMASKRGADTFKCPECGSGVLRTTNYCVKCQKKVKSAGTSKLSDLDSDLRRLVKSQGISNILYTLTDIAGGLANAAAAEGEPRKEQAWLKNEKVLRKAEDSLVNADWV